MTSNGYIVQSWGN